MSTQDFRSGIEELQETLDRFERAMSARSPLLGPPLVSLLASRIAQAIDEGMPILEAECSRRMLAIPPPDTRWGDASLVNALELDLNREENTRLRWLLISYWAVLCSFDAISANVEALVALNLDDLTWLVAGALWVEWASGQPTTYELREALSRVRARHSELDMHLAAALAGPPSAAREAAALAERLLATQEFSERD